jgi:hypothetical protein
MWNVPKKVATAFADATVGTAIVFVHVLLADRVKAMRVEAVRTFDARTRQPIKA